MSGRISDVAPESTLSVGVSEADISLKRIFVTEEEVEDRR
jgi:hypothetical protein